MMHVLLACGAEIGALLALAFGVDIKALADKIGTIAIIVLVVLVVVEYLRRRRKFK